MQNQNDLPKKSRKGLVGLLIFTNFLLCAVLLAGVFFVWWSESHQAAETMAQNQSLQDQLTAAEEKINQLEDTTIPIETFQGYAAQYGVSSEFIQQFFPDKLVYKDDTGIVYADIDESLPQNSYDWQYLLREDGRFSYEAPDGTTAVTGIDVSKHQGEIDWQAVKADGIEFAMLRGVYRGYGESGNLLVDEMFAENLEGALAAGVDVGVYVFSQAITAEEAVEEAELVLEQLNGRQVTYPIVFDMEEIAGDAARTSGLSPKETTDIAIAFCETVKNAGYEPMIYGNLKWMIANMEFERLTEYDKWLAQYYRKPAFPYAFQMWQYTSTGTVNGITGDVDLNLCFVQYPKTDSAQ